MKHIISNNFLSAMINEQGAELCNLIDNNNNELIWQAKPKLWNRHAPLLFPFVGKLKNDTYQLTNKTFHCSQHGFARDSFFILKETTKDHMVFELTENESTLTKYPFRFSLKPCYQLKENSLHIKWILQNNSKSTMPFSIGAHPAFNCPFHENEKFEDYFLEFEKPESLSSMTLKNGLLEGETFSVLNDEKILRLNHNTFDSIDTYVFENFKSGWVELRSAKSKYAIRVSIKGFPFLGVWTKPGAPFLCIEPWFGLADFKNHDGNILSKKGIQLLSPHEIFECEYSIHIRLNL